MGAKPGTTLLLLLLLSTACPVSAQNSAVGKAIEATVVRSEAAVASQKRIDRLDDQTRAMLEKFRAASWQAQQLAVYADQLDELVAAQDQERESIARQLEAQQQTEQELLPLMLRMMAKLETFIELDLPFLQEERKQRLASLKALMGDPEASIAQRFKRILEALQIEAEYGRTLGAERTQVDGRSVDVFRLGRVAMYSLSADGREARIWQAQDELWKPLPHQYVSQVRDGLRMAREYAAPDLLELPVPVGSGVTP
tara:strand:+ start:120 stop:884 length:765 start_codon:yes stop_codon:yes gene_type:complete